jgi:hypothetical protein
MFNRVKASDGQDLIGWACERALGKEEMTAFLFVSSFSVQGERERVSF